MTKPVLSTNPNKTTVPSTKEAVAYEIIERSIRVSRLEAVLSAMETLDKKYRGQP